MDDGQEIRSKDIPRSFRGEKDKRLEKDQKIFTTEFYGGTSGG